MLMNDEDAGDAAQETLVKVLRNLDRYDPDRRFTSAQSVRLLGR